MTELKPLLSLLDDPSEEIFQSVSKKLLQQGSAAISELTLAWEQSTNPLLQNRLENIIDEIEFQDLYNLFKTWLANKDGEYVYGIFLLEKILYPGLDYIQFLDNFNKVYKAVWLEINDYLTPIERVKLINRVLFTNLKFKGENSKKTSGVDYSVSRLLKTKNGSQYSLALLYLALAQKLDFPIFGTALQSHSILCYKKNTLPQHAPEDEVNQSTSFFIYPFYDGAIYGRKYLEIQLTDPLKEFNTNLLDPISNNNFLKNTLISLSNTLINNNFKAKHNKVERILTLFEGV
ncbi:MAG: transglutaminase family protein [Salinivirgaceae bacterium]|nr:transglutaminase family protein [Salinivirgaceae bacterium]MDD4747428.1 transglutaminase family protein [Salinivirgaceae bacterium]MDY0280396.1 transglutaminase family protein [Salinivirgaceae bacterium]